VWLVDVEYIQEVSVLASDCSSMLIDSVVATVPDASCRVISQLIAEATFPVNLAALQMLDARIDEDFEVSDTRLSILVSSLLAVWTPHHSYAPLPCKYRICMYTGQ